MSWRERSLLRRGWCAVAGSVALLGSLLLAAGCADREPAAAASGASLPRKVELQPGAGKLPELLAAEASRAAAEQLRPVAYLHASWCGPCVALDRSAGDPRMKAAFAGTHVIRLDVDAWGKELDAAGLESHSIPAFFLLGADGRPTGRRIDGGAWGDNVPGNMAPPLRAFFAGGG